MKKGSHIQTGVFYAAFIGGGGEPDHSGGSEGLRGRKKRPLSIDNRAFQGWAICEDAKHLCSQSTRRLAQFNQ